VIRENQTGIDFDSLFGPYLKGAKEVTITDTYIRKFHQARNLMELLETIARLKMDSEDVHVHLIAAPDDIGTVSQEEYFSKIQENVGLIGHHFRLGIPQRSSRTPHHYGPRLGNSAGSRTGYLSSVRHERCVQPGQPTPEIPPVQKVRSDVPTTGWEMIRAHIVTGMRKTTHADEGLPRAFQQGQRWFQLVRKEKIVRP